MKIEVSVDYELVFVLDNVERISTVPSVTLNNTQLVIRSIENTGENILVTTNVD